MSIHYFDQDWPEQQETPSRWDYAIGTKWINIKHTDEPLQLRVRFA